MKISILLAISTLVLTATMVSLIMEPESRASELILVGGLLAVSAWATAVSFKEKT